MASPQRLNSAYGLDNPLQLLAALPIVSKRYPKTTDKEQIGQLWINKTTSQIFILTDIAANAAQWQLLTTGIPGAFPWLITNVNGTLQPETGYICNNAGGVTMTLPLVANVGDTYKLMANVFAGWTVAQNAGQYINFGPNQTGLGVAGALVSSDLGDSIEIVCTVPNLGFRIVNATGNITII